MYTVEKIALFLAKLPFRLLAIIMAAVISIVAIIFNLITNLGNIVVGLINLAMILGFLGVFITKDYGALGAIAILFVIEGVFIFLCASAQAILTSISEKLFEFATT